MVVLVLAGIAVVTKAGLAGLVTNSGPRGFTEILFAYASCMANNGLAMAGLNSNTVFYNVTTTIAMLAGRYGLAALALALAGRFAAQPRLPTTPGTLPADTPTFGALVLGTILLVGALCFFLGRCGRRPSQVPRPDRATTGPASWHPLCSGRSRVTRLPIFLAF